MKKLHSVFTDDMDHCYFTGHAPVERHHIFGASNRENSEKRGFIVPLRPDLHPNGSSVGKQGEEVDKVLKESAQRYYEEHYGSREDFIKEFGKSVL